MCGFVMGWVVGCRSGVGRGGLFLVWCGDESGRCVGSGGGLCSSWWSLVAK